MDAQILITVLFSLGIGGLLGVFAKSFLDKQQHKFSKVFEYKEARYKAIMILMWVTMNPTEFELDKLMKHRPDIRNINELDEELKLEYHNAMLFASDEVLSAMSDFLEKKNIEAWKVVTKAIRKDLYL